MGPLMLMSPANVGAPLRVLISCAPSPALMPAYTAPAELCSRFPFHIIPHLPAPFHYLIIQRTNHPDCDLRPAMFSLLNAICHSYSYIMACYVTKSDLWVMLWERTRKCTLWRCKSTPTPKAKLLWMTSHYGPTVVRSVTNILTYQSRYLNMCIFI